MRANGVAERYLHRRRVALREVPGVGARPCRNACAIRSTTGRTSSCSATSASTSCSTSSSAPAIWEAANERLKSDRADRARHPGEVRRARRLHDRRPGRSARPSPGDCRIGPRRRRSFRPSVRTRRCTSTIPAAFNPWVERLAETAGTARSPTFADFSRALRATPRGLPRCGGRLSDHGLNHCYAAPCTDCRGGRHLRPRACRAGGDARGARQVRRPT